MSEWQLIETAIKDEINPQAIPLLLYDADGEVSIGYWDLGWRSWETARPYERKGRPTHWMPLPSPPATPSDAEMEAAGRGGIK